MYSAIWPPSPLKNEAWLKLCIGWSHFQPNCSSTCQVNFGQIASGPPSLCFHIEFWQASFQGELKVFHLGLKTPLRLQGASGEPWYWLMMTIYQQSWTFNALSDILGVIEKPALTVCDWLMIRGRYREVKLVTEEPLKGRRRADAHIFPFKALQWVSQ